MTTTEAPTAGDTEPYVRLGGLMYRDDAELCHLNLIEFWRESTRWGHGGELQEVDGVGLFATGSAYPWLSNYAFRLATSVSPYQVIERADEYFGTRGRGYVITVRECALDDDVRAAGVACGLAESDQYPAMVCRTPVVDRPAPAGIELRVAESPGAVADFAAANSAAWSTYSVPADLVPAIFSWPERVLAAHVRAFVAYDGDLPVAAALTLISHGIAGVYWVGTRAAYRYRNLARTWP